MTEQQQRLQEALGLLVGAAEQCGSGAVKIVAQGMARARQCEDVQERQEILLAAVLSVLGLMAVDLECIADDVRNRQSREAKQAEDPIRAGE